MDKIQRYQATISKAVAMLMQGTYSIRDITQVAKSCGMTMEQVDYLATVIAMMAQQEEEAELEDE